MFENTTNVPKILVLKSSSEQIFSRKLPLGAPVKRNKFCLNDLFIKSNRTALQTYKEEERTFGTLYSPVQQTHFCHVLRCHRFHAGAEMPIYEPYLTFYN